MPLYIQSIYHPDYQNITRTTIEVEDVVFQDNHTSTSLSRNYFLSYYFNVAFPYGYFQTGETSVYVPFSYNSGIISINGAEINAQALTSVIDSSRYPRFLYRTGFQNLLDPNSDAYEVTSNEITVIIINKSYCNFRDKIYEQNGMGEDAILLDDTIYVNFSFAKLISLEVGFAGDYSSLQLLIKSEKTYDYVEDFSNSLFYSMGEYYLDAALTNKANLKIRKEFFPFLLLNNDSQAVRGVVKSNLENLDDLNLVNTGDDLSGDDYVDITPVDPPNLNQNIISCSVNSPGYVDVVYNGSPYSYEDSQICGSSPVTNGNPIAVIRRDNQTDLVLYKDFTTLTSETVSIYAYNFRYIKYVTLVNNATTYTAFKDNGSVASSTIAFLNQQLDLSKYYSIKEDGDGNILGITFRFVIYKSTETESGALTYDLIIPVQIYAPQIVSASYNIDNTKLEIISNYATTIKYYLKGDSSNIQTASVTDTVDGLNQTTSINIDFSSKTITANALGYFYDFNNGLRDPYKSADFNQAIDFSIEITSVALQIKTGSPLATQTFYDSSDSAINNLLISPCYPSSFDNYKIYIDYASNYEIYFYISFTLAAGFKTLYLEIGKEINKSKLTSAFPVSIKRAELFSRADINGNIPLTLWLDNQIDFVIPFRFLNFSTNAPQITSVSTPVLAGGSKASVSFNFVYKYADSLSYTILDNDGLIIYGPVEIKRKEYPELYDLFSSGSSVSQSIKTDSFDIPPSSTSLKVRVVAANINSSFTSQEVSLDSSFKSIPKRLNKETPAVVNFYSDEAMTVQVNYISRAVTYYAFLQLKDVDGNDVPVANYSNYISTNPSPEFVAVESQDQNLDLQGVSVTKISDYLYSFKIDTRSSFNDDAFVLDITYSPIIDLEK